MLHFAHLSLWSLLWLINSSLSLQSLFSVIWMCQTTCNYASWAWSGIEKYAFFDCPNENPFINKHVHWTFSATKIWIIIWNVESRAKRAKICFKNIFCYYWMSATERILLKMISLVGNLTQITAKTFGIFVFVCRLIFRIIATWMTAY